MLLSPTRSLVLSVFALVGAGCAGTAAPIVPLPVPEVERPAPPPEPVPVAVEVAVVAPPVAPPPTPERRIARRAVYESVGLTEWTLENGLTVLYLQRPGDGYHARLDAPTGWAGLPRADQSAFAHIGAGRWGPLTARLGPDSRAAEGESETLDGLVGAIRALLSSPPAAVAPFDAGAQAAPRWAVVSPARADQSAARLADAFNQPQAFTVVLTGALGAEWVEPLIASELSVRRGGATTFQAAQPTVRGDVTDSRMASGVVAEWSVSGAWADLPTVRLLAAVVAGRVPQGVAADVVFDAARETIRLRIASNAAFDSTVLRAPLTAAEADVARRRALDHANAAAGMAQTVADLFALPGQYRPARRPDDAATLPAAIARTPSDRVDALLRRLLASPDTARLGATPTTPDTP